MSLPVVADSIESYLAEVGRFPVLTREEEHALAVDYREKQDLDSAHKLVTSNLRFVVKVALEYRGYGVALKDLIQEGNLGLMNAVKKYNPYKGTRLITYAVWWIKAFIQEFILKSRGMVRHSTKALKKKLFYRNAGETASRALAADTNVEIDARDLSLDAPLGDGHGTTHLDMLVDTAGSPDDLIEARDGAALKEVMGAALSTLNDNERLVVARRVMAEEPESLQSIGSMLGLTRERVRQIEKGALVKLRKFISLDGTIALPEA